MKKSILMSENMIIRHWPWKNPILRDRLLNMLSLSLFEDVDHGWKKNLIEILICKKSRELKKFQFLSKITSSYANIIEIIMALNIASTHSLNWLLFFFHLQTCYFNLQWVKKIQWKNTLCTCTFLACASIR